MACSGVARLVPNSLRTGSALSRTTRPNAPKRVDVQQNERFTVISLPASRSLGLRDPLEQGRTDQIK